MHFPCIFVIRQKPSGTKHDIWPPSFDRGTFGRRTIYRATFNRWLIDRRDITPPPNSLQCCYVTQNCYSDIMMLVSYNISKDTATTKSKKMTIFDDLTRIWCPIQRTPTNIGITLTYKLEFLHYISAAGSMCLHFIQSLVMGCERQAHNVRRVNYCRSRSSKVIDFATNPSDQ